MRSSGVWCEKTGELLERQDINRGEGEAVRKLFSRGVGGVQAEPAMIKMPGR
jgi:hypothetical protein